MGNDAFGEEKYRRMFALATNWWLRRNDGFSISDIILQKGYRNIAIYGMDQLGLILLDELCGGEVNVCYGIDRNAYGIFCQVKMYLPEDDLKPVDAVIVTAISYFDSIYNYLSDRIDCPIISLESLVYTQERICIGE